MENVVHIFFMFQFSDFPWKIKNICIHIELLYHAQISTNLLPNMSSERKSM